MKKKIAIALYATYSVLLVLIITFAGGVGKWLTDSFKEVILKNNIKDVVIDVDVNETLEAQSNYKFNYTVVGRYFGDAGIVFESNNTDALVVSGGSNPTIHTYSKFDGDEVDVKVTATSLKDKKFNKTITFRVKKIYPTVDDFEANYYVEAGGWNSSEIKVGMKIYPYGGISDNRYTNEYRVTYDPEYIHYDDERKVYVATKETPGDMKLNFGVLYPNGERAYTKGFSIVPYTEVESFDEIRVKNEPVQEIYITKNESFVPRLYKEGKILSSKVDISYTNPQNVYTTETGHYKFNEIGDYTFTFTLPNGFSKTVDVHVRNLMKLPIVKGNAKVEGNRITVSNSEEAIRLSFEYPDNITYRDATVECESNIVNITADRRLLYIQPKKMGVSTFKLIWDDGYDKLENSYTVEVVKDNNPALRISEAIKTFVSKIMGHATLFAILAAFTFFMFKHITIGKEWLKATLYFSSVLPTAVLTEIIQSFDPKRHARFADVLIDACGFLLGTAIYALVLYFKCKKTSNKILAESKSLKMRKLNTALAKRDLVC